MRCYLKLGLMGAAALVALPGAALAQRASDNVTTQSSDAFGRSVGNEKSGLYTTDDVRGFNPVDAGNVRLGSISIRLTGSRPGWSMAARSGLARLRSAIRSPRRPDWSIIR